MAALKAFTDLESKKELFSDTQYFIIDTKEQFDRWFKYYTSDIKEGKKTDFIFRGMSDARFKLYTSAQRMWIQNDMSEWANVNYLGFIDRMIQVSKSYPLFRKVFNIFRYSNDEREFPLLSILQHYAAPTPLMDWTYNINVALFFATEKLTEGHGTGSIGNYFSIYRINKRKYRNEFLNISDVSGYVGKPISFFEPLAVENNANPNANVIYYISDFDEGNAYNARPNSRIVVNNGRPITSIYNQNIIPQEGLFIFNPFTYKTIDEIFNIGINDEGANLALAPFACFNIKKDLADYVRRHIKEASAIDKSFIYPHLYTDAESIKNKVLNEFSG
jgi:hypothetical protein